MARTDSITDDLRDDILAGVYSPGERLVELQLSDRYTCGRATVRAALVELTKEGLVEREANRGATVRRLTLSQAVQITEARAALESLIAANAARHASDSERLEVAGIIEDMRAAVAADEQVAYSDLNRVFHRRLREISRHGVAAGLVANLRDRAAHHQYRLALMPGRSAGSIEQHAAIADAVIAGDEQRAAEAMDAHLRSVIDVLTQWGDAAPI